MRGFGREPNPAQVTSGNTMAWEARNGRGRYYTRSRKMYGRVVREYVGTGAVAELMAQADALTRDQRQRMRDELRDQRENEKARDVEVSAFCDIAVLWSRVALLAAGYHRHDRGEWRRRRERK